MTLRVPGRERLALISRLCVDYMLRVVVARLLQGSSDATQSQ